MHRQSDRTGEKPRTLTEGTVVRDAASGSVLRCVKGKVRLYNHQDQLTVLGRYTISGQMCSFLER
ncbi:hypothetical protein E2C01_005877 [Portunus trituberculatus]|uniref:Uncharacterized protein n=1 Tax=Portunus trituberculatus TaxID=210409 RepID=A0A5B7CXR7_PORTR|nr:hypothetical protein [Portunus trituberculatus]